jgi:oxygen-independent coproporphyrinogen-3 oxidase
VEGAPVGVLGDLGLSPEAEPTADLIADGFLAVMDGRLVATPRGRPVLDGVLKALLT